MNELWLLYLVLVIGEWTGVGVKDGFVYCDWFYYCKRVYNVDGLFV